VAIQGYKFPDTVALRTQFRALNSPDIQVNNKNSKYPFIQMIFCCHCVDHLTDGSGYSCFFAPNNNKARSEEIVARQEERAVQVQQASLASASIRNFAFTREISRDHANRPFSTQAQRPRSAQR
jgi:hypothetical protein